MINDINNIEKNIEENLFSFYRDISECAGVPYGEFEGLEYVMNSDQAWPAFILGSTKEDAYKLEVISGMMNSQQIPSFWLRNAADDEGFESEAARFGIRKINEWKGMYLERRLEFIQPTPLDDVVFNEIKTKEELSEWLSVIGSELMTGKKIDIELFNTLLNNNSFRFFCGARHGETISTVLTYTSKGTSGIYLVSTRSNMRRKGIGSWITKSAINALIKEGNNSFVLHATKPGFSLYNKIGFETFCNFSIYWMIKQI